MSGLAGLSALLGSLMVHSKPTKPAMSRVAKAAFQGVYEPWKRKLHRRLAHGPVVVAIAGVSLAIACLAAFKMTWRVSLDGAIDGSDTSGACSSAFCRRASCQWSSLEDVVQCGGF